MTGSLQIKKDKFYMVLNLTQNGKRRQKCDDDQSSPTIA